MLHLISEYLIRFVVGGVVVSVFAMLGEMLRPRSFAGLLGAAPSVALASLSLAVLDHGPNYAAIEAHAMVFGAIALACFSVMVCQLVARTRLRALPSTLLALTVWLAVAFGLQWALPGVG